MEDTDDKESTKFEDEKKANILQKQFSSIFTWEPEGEIPKLDIRTYICIYNLLVTEEMVRREIVNLNVYKVCGPDEINPRLLIELVDTWPNINIREKY